MDPMVLVLFVLGLVCLVVGAEVLVRGASHLATAMGIPSLIVGLTVVAFGTSAPEMAVSTQAAWTGRGDLALGNVVGSNIFNILLILGLSAAITPLIVAQRLVRLDVPLVIGASLLVLLLALDGRIGRWDGLLLFTGILAYTVLAVVQGRREGAAVAEEYDAAYHRRGPGMGVNIGLILGGLALLVVGSGWLVDGAVAIARAFGMSELVIGLTIVAGGTSLPEVATSVLASVRGERDIAVGNVIGSNLFNLLAVLGLAGLVAPEGIQVAGAALRFDIPVMIAVAAACLPIFFTGYTIARWEGWLFLGYYLAYTLFLIFSATGHGGLHSFTTGMVVFVIPLTLLTLAVTTLRHRRRNGGSSPAGRP